MRTYSITAALLLVAAPLAAQDREMILSVYGGGADHLADLEPSPPAWFMPGYAVGTMLGVPLNDHWGMRVDFTYTRNPVEGSGALAGGDVNRFFYGVQADYRFPMGEWNPHLFAGLGAVSIDQLDPEAFDPTTRPVLTLGGGVVYRLPEKPVGILGEIRGQTYNWNMAGFDRNMLDVTYVVGLVYRLGW